MGQIISYIITICCSNVHGDERSNAADEQQIIQTFQTRPCSLNDIWVDVDPHSISSSSIVEKQVVFRFPNEADLGNHQPNYKTSTGVVEEKPDVCITIPCDNGNKSKKVVEVIKENVIIPCDDGYRSKEVVEVIKGNVIKISKETAQKKRLRKKDRWIKHYCSSHKILLVGEGDFSFSACLANAFGSANDMVATSLDSAEFLKTNYNKAISNITKLKKLGCMVIHGVDVTKMTKHPSLQGVQFDRIVYNFPLAGFFHGISQEKQIRKNQHLIRTFLQNGKKMISEDGEIHITHKAYGFFLKWDLQVLASNLGLELIKEVVFNVNDYPGYNTKCGFGGDSNFRCFGSQTYKFGLK